MPYFRAHFRQRTGSQSVVDRYFSPPSGAMETMTPLSISFAFFRAMWNMAPELGPTKMPSCRASSLAASSAFFGWTLWISSTRSFFQMDGTYWISRFFKPWMDVPFSGSTAIIWTSGLYSLSRLETPIRVPVVPIPATKWVTLPFVSFQISSAVVS